MRRQLTPVPPPRYPLPAPFVLTDCDGLAQVSLPTGLDYGVVESATGLNVTIMRLLMTPTGFKAAGRAKEWIGSGGQVGSGAGMGSQRHQWGGRGWYGE